MLWVLAWIAGYVDTVAYLVLVRVYVSHMSGNTSFLGRYLSRAEWNQAFKYGWPILSFALGLFVGAMLAESSRRRRIQSRMSLVMGVEIGLLAAMLLLANRHAQDAFYWVAAPASAMGMQTATVTTVGDLRVYSTFVTGMLSKLSEALAGYIFWLSDHFHARREGGVPGQGWLREAVRHRLLWHALVTFGIWALFMLGCVSGAIVQLELGLRAFWVPIAGLGLLIGLDLRRPISAVAEHEPLGFLV